MKERQIIRSILVRAYNNLCLRAVVTGAFALVWWGILYPELCFTESTCEQVIIADGQEIVVEQADFQDILSVSGDEIVIKSRLLEWLEQKINKK